jgi:hypothetical protein
MFFTLGTTSCGRSEPPQVGEMQTERSHPPEHPKCLFVCRSTEDPSITLQLRNDMPQTRSEAPPCPHGSAGVRLQIQIINTIHFWESNSFWRRGRARDSVTVYTWGLERPIHANYTVDGSARIVSVTGPMPEACKLYN